MEVQASRAEEVFFRAAGFRPREDRRSIGRRAIMASVYNALLRA